MLQHAISLIVHGSLKDFLARELRGKRCVFHIKGNPSIKDTLEAVGAPHPEIAGILVNKRSVDFSYQIQGGEDIEIFPAEAFPSGLAPLQPPLPTPPIFIVDVNLGKLVGKLRLMGFDSLYKNDLDDHRIVRIASEQQRVILTRDRGLLKHGAVVWGYWVRTTDPSEQLLEVARRYDLQEHLAPMTRCSACNGLTAEVAKEEIADRLQPRTRKYYDRFRLCRDCGKIYWAGSHYRKILEWVEALAGPEKKRQT